MLELREEILFRENLPEAYHGVRKSYGLGEIFNEAGMSYVSENFPKAGNERHEEDIFQFQWFFRCMYQDYLACFHEEGKKPAVQQ